MFHPPSIIAWLLQSANVQPMMHLSETIFCTLEKNHASVIINTAAKPVRGEQETYQICYLCTARLWTFNPHDLKLQRLQRPMTRTCSSISSRDIDYTTRERDKWELFHRPPQIPIMKSLSWCDWNLACQFGNYNVEILKIWLRWPFRSLKFG